MKKLVTVFAGLALATPALADDYREEITEVVTGTPQPESGYGISVNIGGGVTGFSGQTMRDLTSDAGGSWNARVSLGTRMMLGLDLQYNGTATKLDSFNDVNNVNVDTDATLIGTGLEAAARLNFMPKQEFTPYAFGGVGWQHYSITNNDNDRALVVLNNDDTEDLAAFPVGGGLSYRDPSGLNVDLRGTYRFTQKSDNIRDIDGDRARLDTWEATGNLGFEF